MLRESRTEYLVSGDGQARDSDDEQIADDPELLELMLADLASAPAPFQPTNYWKVYADRLVPELRRSGLRNFRRRRNSHLVSFGASEPAAAWTSINLARSRWLNNKVVERIPGWQRVLRSLNGAAARLLERLPQTTMLQVTQSDLLALAYVHAEHVGRTRGAKPLSQISTSRLGRPGCAVEIDGRFYTPSFLSYYLRYTYARQYMDFDTAAVVAELAPGYGGQAEVFAKLYPNLTLLLFDLPPQLYVLERYLSSVFGARVVSYREARGLSSSGAFRPGMIHVLPNWKMPLLREVAVDFFASAISLDEIDRTESLNYLSLAAERSHHIYLAQNIGGVRVASAPGMPGVLERTTWSDYETLLQRDYELLGRGPLLHPGRPLSSRLAGNPHLEGFWRRRAEAGHR